MILRLKNLATVVFLYRAEDVVDVSFVDDLACNVIDSATLLPSKVCKIASCAFDVFACYGMRINFEAGKSECVIHFCGFNLK